MLIINIGDGKGKKEGVVVVSTLKKNQDCMKKMDTHSMILSFFFATLQTLHSPKGKKKQEKNHKKYGKH